MPFTRETRYKVRKGDRGDTLIKVGFLKGTTKKSKWIRAAVFKQQEGTQIPLDEKIREYFLTFPPKIGARPIGFSKGTTHLSLPRRPIIEPFMRRYQNVILKNVEKNFDILQAGGRA